LLHNLSASEVETWVQRKGKPHFIIHQNRKTGEFCSCNLRKAPYGTALQATDGKRDTLGARSHALHLGNAAARIMERG
jgi:hypothetical protein